MQKTLSTFLAGIILGAVIVYAGFSYSNTSRDDARVQAESTLRNTLISGAKSWQGRAETCEQKFNTTTLLVEPRQAPPGPSLPLLNGAVSLTLNNFQAPHGLSATWAIPAQVTPASTLPGAQYVWIEHATGKIIGTYLVAPTAQNT